MSQPPPYVRFQDYSDYQITHQLPGPALAGDDIDADFNRIKTTLDAVLTNLSLIQRDDGALKNASVSPDTITSALAIMIANWEIRGPWVTLATYALKDYVTSGGNGYVCIEPHTAGVFATDLAAGKWSLVSTKGDQGIQGIQGIQGVAGAAGITRPSFVNRLINGDFAIDQRNEGAAKTYTAAANVAYGPDRWYASCTGANVTGQRVVGTGANQFAYQFTGLVGNTGIVFGQRIEAANISDQLSGQVTVQVWLSSSSITTVTWKTFSANTIDAWGTKSTTGTGTETLIDTGTLTITSTPTLYTFTTNLGANAGRGIDLEFSFGALLAAQTIKFEAVQIEPGTVANTFERPDFSTRLCRVQRYYAKTYELGTAPGAVSSLGNQHSQPGGTALRMQWRFPVVMRAAPTVTAYSPTDGASGNVRNFTAASNLAVGSTPSANEVVLTSNGATAANLYAGQIVADAEL